MYKTCFKQVNLARALLLLWRLHLETLTACLFDSYGSDRSSGTPQVCLSAFPWIRPRRGGPHGSFCPRSDSPRIQVLSKRCHCEAAEESWAEQAWREIKGADWSGAEGNEPPGESGVTLVGGERRVRRCQWIIPGSRDREPAFEITTQQHGKRDYMI